LEVPCWYFSDVREKVKQIGVVVADHPIGPWSDPLGRPMLTPETGAEVYDSEGSQKGTINGFLPIAT